MKSYSSSLTSVTIDLLFHDQVITLCSKFVFRSFLGFSWLYFRTSKWKLVASFHMKSYNSSLTFVKVYLLFVSYCPLFKIPFPDFSWLCAHIFGWKFVAIFGMKSYRSSSTFVTNDLLFMSYNHLLKKCFIVFGTFLFSRMKN